MGFFFCPRLRRYRKASDSSDVVSAYPLGQIEPSSPTHECAEGDNEMYSHPSRAGPLTEIGVFSSTDEQNRSEHISNSSGGGLSGKLRRRFSRDVRNLSRRPKKLHRGPKIPFLHFPSKHAAVHIAPVASHDLGSSLMSTRGYDSDAQYIATPRHPIYTTEYQASRPRNGMAVFPRHPPLPLRESDLDLAREQPFGLTVDTRGMAYEQPPYHGEGSESQLSWRSRDLERRTPQVAAQESSSNFHNVDLGSPRGRPLSPCPSVSRAWAQERPALAPMRLQEMYRPHTPQSPMSPPMPRGGSFEDSTGRHSGHGHDMGGSVYPSHHVLQQQCYTTSADSLTGCPPQLSVRKRHQQPRREITRDEQSLHLGEMNIHRILASSGSTSQVQSQKHLFDENQSRSNAGTWNTNGYQTINTNAMPQICDASETRSPPVQPSSIQDPRSPYSPNTSVASAGYDYDQRNCVSFAQDSSANVPSRRAYLPSEHASASAAAEETNVLRSKFTERFGSDSSVGHAGYQPHGDDTSASTRKVSIGWMSEGRRIGYGYTLVPPDNSHQGHEKMHCKPALPESCGSIRDSPKGPLAGSVNGYPERRKSTLGGKTSQMLSKTSEPDLDMSAILQRLDLARWAGANLATLRPNNNSDAGSCDSGGSSLFGILTNKKKNRGEVGSNFDVDNPWEFCSWVRPTQSLGGQKAPRLDDVGSREHAEAQLVEKLATLRRRGGAWATKCKLSEIVRNFEKRADHAVAKFTASTDRFPVVQRTATRVLRLRAPGSKERPRRMHVNDPTTFSENHFDSLYDAENFQHRPSERTSLGSSGDWDSLYEECVEKHSIPG